MLVLNIQSDCMVPAQPNLFDKNFEVLMSCSLEQQIAKQSGKYVQKN